MIRLLIVGIVVIIVMIGWILSSGSESEISSLEKSVSNTNSQERSFSSARDQTASVNSPASDLKTSDHQGTSSPSANPSNNFQRGVHSVSTKDSAAATSPTRTASSGINSSAQVSGSTLGSSSQLNSAASSGGFVGGPIREITIPVPVGVKVPALFQDDTPKPPQQMKALDRIASEFERNVSEIPAGMTKEEVWEAARLIADERYMTLFGYQAYNQYHIKAAKEALKEKRANSKAP
jgi:hypothetical protein